DGIRQEAQRVAGVVDYQRLILAGERAHEAANLLNVRREGLAQRPAQQADANVRHVEALGQGVATHKPGDGAVGLAKLGNLLAPLLLVIVIADVLEIEPYLSEGAADLLTVGNGAAENDGFGRNAVLLARALDVLGHHVADDLHTLAL
ncbi:MAG: hypothetical protein QOJ15_8135, partial [Bradyrhizobium sp.]|nr:hypothetical protein [Bradyrhizobium sp.]